MNIRDILDKLDTINETTCAGSVATVAAPLGKTRKRKTNEEENEWMRGMKADREGGGFQRMVDGWKADPKSFAKWISRQNAARNLTGLLVEIFAHTDLTWNDVEAAFQAGSVFPYVQDELRAKFGDR